MSSRAPLHFRLPVEVPLEHGACQADSDTVPFLSCPEAQKLRFQGRGPLRSAPWPFLAWSENAVGPPLRQRSRKVPLCRIAPPRELCGPASRVSLFVWIVSTPSLALSPACGFGRWT